MNIQTPNRVAHTFVQHLVAEPETVFPLLCPVREADWIEGWDPLLVMSKTGIAEVDCVFITAAESADAIWYVTRHEPDAGLVEMLKITPDITACRLCIQLRATNSGCDATVTYMHTSLGAAGDDFVAGFTAEYYTQFMHAWEARLNDYLMRSNTTQDQHD